MKRVGVLRGGNGEHYHASLQQGGDLILHLLENLKHKYHPIDILIDRAGVWHLGGRPIVPADLIHKVDVVWNTGHHSSALVLDDLAIANVGSSSLVNTFKNSQEILRAHTKDLDIQIPRSLILPVYQQDFDGSKDRYALKKATEIFEKFSSPWVIRASTLNSGMGIHLVQTFPELVRAIEDGIDHRQGIVVEEFIKGKVATVHSLSGFRGADIYTFPPMDIFGKISAQEKEKLSKLSKDLHRHIGVEHYLKSSFVISSRGRVYLLQVESMPDLKPDSYFSRACESVGAQMHHIIDHILENS